MSGAGRSAIVRLVAEPPLLVPSYYDFASTLSYVAHRVLGRLGDRLAAAGVRLVWQPIDLAQVTGWRRGAVVEGPRREHVVAVARTLAGDVRMPRVWLDSRRAARIALALGAGPAAAAWRERVWTAIYEEGRDPGDAAELRRWARELGLDVDALALPAGALGAATRSARAAGVAAVPTLLLGEWPMAGIQEDATMLALLTRFAERRRAAAESGSSD